jgi:hypothetical protein
MAIVYVAGASRELARVQRAFDLVGAATLLDLAHDWLKVQAQEPIPDDQLARAQARRYAAEDLAHVVRADLVWLLAPNEPTKGAWIEFGYALARGEGKRVVVSGPCEQSIFCALADEEHADDVKAFDAIVEWATQQRVGGDGEAKAHRS